MVSLEYEAYLPMAEKELEALATEIRDKWPEVEHVILQVLLLAICVDRLVYFHRISFYSY